MDEVAGDSPSHHGVAGDVGARASDRPAQWSPRGAELLIWLISSRDGRWARECSKDALGLGIFDDMDGFQVHALAHAHAALLGPEGIAGEQCAVMARYARLRIRHERPAGYVVYQVDRVVAAADPIDIEEASFASPADFWLQFRNHVAEGGKTFFEYAQQMWRCRGSPTIPVLYRVCPDLCRSLCSGIWTVAHIVAFAGKVNRSQLLNAFPSPTTLQRFRKHIAQKDDTAAENDVALVGRNSWNSMPAVLLLKWVKATAYIKKLQDAKKAALAFADVLFDVEHTDLLQAMPSDRVVNLEVLRKARVRTDIVAMLVFRLAFPQWQESASFYLWTDSSPQWRGREFCATTVDTLHEGKLKRRLMPGLNLRKGRTSALQKTIAVLWQCFLMVGAENLQCFCQQVRAIVTDQGAERLVCRQPITVLQNFLRELGSNVLVSLDSDFIFPNALPMAGWKHMWDLLTRRGLFLLPWMPLFIKRIKALTKFLREDLDLLCQDLGDRGHCGLAGMLRKAAMPNFAAWRWATLDRCCEEVSKWASSLAMFFNAKPFRCQRDKAGLKLVMDALYTPAFHDQLRVVSWFCSQMTRVLNWGAGCSCHSQAWHTQEERDSCQWKGRRLGEAWQYGMKAMDLALAEIQSWSAADLNDNAELLRQAQACMRGAWLLARDKLAFLDTLPFLLGRLEQAGVRDRVLAQFDECAVNDHDPISVRFLEPGCSFRRDIEAMNPDGSNMSERLANEWEALRRSPIDDTPGESPHARLKYVQTNRKAASWAFQVATERLNQNLNDIAEMMPTITPAVDLQFLWDRPSSILRVCKGKKALQNRRLKRLDLEDRVYTMSQFWNFKIEDMAPVEYDEDKGDEDPDGRPEEEHVDAEEDEADTDGNGKLLEDYYKGLLSSKIGCFFSLLDDEGSHKPFQLLGYKQVVSLVKTHRKAKKYVIKLSIMWLEVWRARLEEMPQSMDVFECEDPEHVDLYRWVSALDDRRKLHLWSEAPSDTEGCVRLITPEVAVPKISLSSTVCPVLCLLDALKEKGFECVERTITHKPEVADKLLDIRNLSKRRYYFQAVLSMAALWARGVTEFKSGHASYYYLLLLGNRLDGLTKDNWRKRVAELQGDVDIDALKRPAKLLRADPGIAGDEGIAAGVGLPEPGADAIAGDPAPAAEDIGSPSSSSSSSSRDADEGIAADAGGAGGYEPPAYIEGCKVTVESHGAVRGLRAKCGRHAGCRKFVSLGIDPYGMGHRFAEFYLGAWLRMPAGTAEQHRPKPAKWQVEAYRADVLG